MTRITEKMKTNIRLLKHNSLFWLWSLCLFTPIAQANWVSDGGEVGGNANNPWFISNTNYINYCIEMDEDSFSISKSDAEKLIKKSIEFWKLDLSHAEYNRNVPQVRQGTQTFVHKQELCSSEVELTADACEVGDSLLANSDETINLVFRFGALSDRHMDKLDELELDPRKHIGFSMRTSYCNTSMRGKGFIYISPDQGDQSYELSLIHI